MKCEGILLVNQETLCRYIKSCDEILEAQDAQKAKKLEETIVPVLRNDIEGITNGLKNYNFYGADNIDYLEDLQLLRERLYVELEKLGGNIEQEKNKMLFISHSSNDVNYIKELVALLEYIGLRDDDMVCSSVPAYGIPLGQDIYDWLREKFKTCDLHVLFVLSHNFYNSAACLNEMGAAWVLRQKYDFILLPGFDFSDIRGSINSNQIGIKLDGDKDEIRQQLGQLKDRIIDEFGLRKIPEIRWEKKREEFLDKVTMIGNSNDPANNTNTTDTLSKEACLLLAYASKDKNGQIEVYKDITSTGPNIETCGWNFTVGATARELAQWNDALRVLEYYSMIEDESNAGEVYRLTKAGYENADNVIEQLRVDINNDPHEYL